MFASESSHASSFKKFLDLRVPKNRNQRRSALLEYMHWDLMMPHLKKKKKKKKIKKHILQIKEKHFDLLLFVSFVSL